jgi:dihydrofolate synthase/folylpolyglutamate synthase
VRPHATGATQFEVLTAAALAEFAAQAVEVAVVEAGLGGRHDATNVIDARVVLLTNVALDHTDVLGDTREQIAKEKLAVVTPGATVVLGEAEWEPLARERGAGRIVFSGDVGRAAAEAFLGRELEGEVEAAVPGRLDFSGEDVYAGAHNPAGIEWLVTRIPRDDYVVCAAILADKDTRSMLAMLARVGTSFIATEAETERTLPADVLAGLAREFFADVESVPDATAALDRAAERARPNGAVLVTGSLYLVRDVFGRLETVR